MSIADKLITVANNTSAVATAVNSTAVAETGTVLRIDNIAADSFALQTVPASEVKIYNKNLFNVDGREVRNFGALANTTQRTFTENSIYLNLALNNYCNAGHKMQCEIISNNSFTVLTPSSSSGGWEAYGAGFNFRVKPNTTYSVSASSDKTKGKIGGCNFYDADGNYISNTTKTKNVVTPDNCAWMNVLFRVQLRDEAVLFENVQLEIGDTITEYEQYKEPQILTADNTGKITNISIEDSVITIIADNELECSYRTANADVVYAKYQQLKQAKQELVELLRR